jgi:threonine dehydrogenase-like Zn-dependent dehydrogenase
MLNYAAKKVDEVLGKTPVAQTTTQPLRSENEVMRAIVWKGKQQVALETVGRPLITHPKDVIVRVTAFSICSGSDGHLFAGEIPTTDVGLTLGHEAMGVIAEKGAEVQKFNIGDRVVIAFDVACGECELCKREEYTGCKNTNDSRLAEKFYGHQPAGIFGYSRLVGNVPGSQAEYVRVPFADTTCYPVPDDVPDEKALYMSDVLCTSLHAVDMGEVKEGESVCIWGLGPIGLCAARWCQIRGASLIVGIDMVPERLELARQKLGIQVIDRRDMTSAQVVERLNRMMPDGFDVAIEAAGFRFAMSTAHKMARAVGIETDTPEILDECLTAIRQFGRVSIIGDYAGYAMNFPVGKIMFKHATIRSGQCPCQKYFPYVMEKLRDGTMDPTFMITHRIKLEDVPTAYQKLFNKEDGYIKVFATP